MTAPHEEPQDRYEAELEAATFATERVITFSDAVVAIAITLLALGLPVPQLTDGMSDSQVLHALGHNWSDYLAFLISFWVIGGHWSSHRQVFRYVSRWNQVVGRLNMLWLLMMVMTPFGARLLAASGGFAIRFTIYVIIQIISTACLALMSLEIAHAHLLRPGAPDKARYPDILPFAGFCVAFLISIPVAFATAKYGDWAYVLWGFTSLTTRLLRHLVGNGRNGRHGA